MSRAPVVAKAVTRPRKAAVEVPVRPALSGVPVTTQLHLGSGERLPVDVRRYFEPRFGVDFSNVRLHRDQAGAEAAEGAGAKAFTVGQHIAFNEGRFAPGTIAGRQLLGHELAHVVQQSRGGAVPGGHRGSATEQDAGQAGTAAALGAESIPVRASSGLGMARDVDDKTAKNAGLADQLYTSFLSSPFVPEGAKKAVEGTNNWLKQEASKYGITEDKQREIVATVVQAVGPQAIASATTAVAPLPPPPPQPMPVAVPRQPPRAKPPTAPKAPPKSLIDLSITLTDEPDFVSDKATSGPWQPPQFRYYDQPRRPPADVPPTYWLGDPSLRPEWTKGLQYWNGPNGELNLYTPQSGTTTWTREGKQLGAPPPGTEQLQRSLRADEELRRSGGIRHVEGRGDLDEAGWQAYLQERKAAQREEAERKLHNLEGGVAAWDKTQGGAAYFASVPSHVLGGTWFNEPGEIVARTRQSVEIALHEIEMARTPEELAEAEEHAQFATHYGDYEFGAHKDKVYVGGENTITGIKVGAAVTTAVVAAPVLATYGTAGVTLKVVGYGALAGGGLSLGRQGAQMLDGTCQHIDFGEAGQGALMGGGLALFPEFAPVMMGAGVASSADEFSQGHVATGAFDAAMVMIPLGKQAAPEIGAYVRPRVAAAGFRVGVAMNDFPVFTGGSGAPDIPNVGDSAYVLEPTPGGQTTRGPSPPSIGGKVPAGNFLTIDVSPKLAPQFGDEPIVVQLTPPEAAPPATSATAAAPSAQPPFGVAAEGPLTLKYAGAVTLPRAFPGWDAVRGENYDMFFTREKIGGRWVQVANQTFHDADWISYKTIFDTDTATPEYIKDVVGKALNDIVNKRGGKRDPQPIAPDMYLRVTDAKPKSGVLHIQVPKGAAEKLPALQAAADKALAANQYDPGDLPPMRVVVEAW